MRKKVELKNLHKAFGEKVILNDVSFDIYDGEILCVIGKSGTGKSVVLKHLVGMLEPDSGEIFVDDENFTTADRDTKEKIISKYGILFQGAALFDSMTIYENIAFGLKRKGVPQKEYELTVQGLLEQIGLKGMGDLLPDRLSGGMQKRVGLARSIAIRPEIMLYDEPTTGVDPITGGSVDKLIVEMNKKYNITSVVVTHDMKSAYRIAHRIIMLYEGKIIFTGKPDDVKNSNDPIIKQFIAGTANGPIKVI